MGEIFEIDLLSQEVKTLCWINERFESEPYEVKKMRRETAKIMAVLCDEREKAFASPGRTEKWRNFSLAITHLEDACIRAVRWLCS